MSVLARTLSSQSKKPQKWPASMGRVVPDWRWSWRNAELLVPMWSGAGPPFDASPHHRAMLMQAGASGVSEPVWNPTRYGVGLTFDAADASDSTGTADLDNYVEVDGWLGITGTTARSFLFTFRWHDDLGLGRGNATWFGYGDNDNTAGRRFTARIDSEGNAQGVRIEANGGFQTFDIVVSDGEWHTAIVTFPDGGNVTDTRCWIDGVEAGVDASSSVVINTEAEVVFTIARNQPSGAADRNFDGDMAVFGAWSRELSPTEAIHLSRDPFGPFRMSRPTMVVVPAVPETLQRSTRLEASRTNHLTQSEDFSHADWTASNVTVTADAATAPDGATTADNLSDTASGAHGFVSQGHTVADDSLDDAASVHLEKKLSAHIAMIGLEYSGGTGLVYEAEIDLLTGETDTANSPDTPTRVVVEDWDTFWRVSVVGANNGTGNTTGTVKVYPHVGSTLGTRDVSVTGDADAWGVQLEDGAFPSSYIETTSSAVTRAADDASEDFTSAPQEMTVYCKFVETGQAFQGTAGDIWAIGDHSAGPSWRLEGTGPDGQLKLWFNGPSNADQLVFDAGGIGDVVEFRSVLRATDEMEQGVAINGDPESTYGPQSLTDGIPSSWGGDIIFLARRSNSAGFADLLALTISSGVKTMSEMRSLADSKAGDLYSYYPGDTGLTFSRASVATHRRATRELATADSGELRDAHYVPRRVGGEVQITASARVAIQSEVSDSASARVASRAERAETASLRAALRGEARTLASLNTALRGEQSDDASFRAALRGETSEAVSLRAALAGAVAEAASLVSALAGQLSEDATVRAALRAAVSEVSSLRVALQSEASDVASLRAALRAEQQADASMRITTVQEGEVTSAASIRASVQGEAAVLSAVRVALLGETAVDMSALIAARAEVEAAATGRIERVDQILRPDADVANPDAWVNELGATTDLWQSLDEVVPDHTDWIEGPP